MTKTRELPVTAGKRAAHDIWMLVRYTHTVRVCVLKTIIISPGKEKETTARRKKTKFVLHVIRMYQRTLCRIRSPVTFQTGRVLVDAAKVFAAVVPVGVHLFGPFLLSRPPVQEL